ncbi:hypothetical protein T4A_10611 [Trichinella pseudospiralis]|uniref:Uncharacterized protein n=1 Tax=Trichinella pseudospiralis TaxID=6337 RepID=A0A0V1ERW9_TRIPS|nr:hypothetical protein T4A_10611 [Trichinella pseudospiralis]
MAKSSSTDVKKQQRCYEKVLLLLELLLLYRLKSVDRQVGVDLARCMVYGIDLGEMRKMI